MNREDLPALLASRQWLLSLHAAAEGARNPKLLRRARAALGAVDNCIAVLSEPQKPARVARSLRQPMQDTRAMDLRPTCYGPPSSVARTELMTQLEVMP